MAMDLGPATKVNLARDKTIRPVVPFAQVNI